MSKTADEAWAEYEQPSRVAPIEKRTADLRAAVEATAREIAREELANDSPSEVGEQGREGRACPTDGCPPYGDQKISEEGVCEHCGHEVPDPPAPSEGEEGESVEGEAFAATGYKGWVKVRVLDGGTPKWPDKTPVRITKLPETQEDDDGAE